MKILVTGAGGLIGSAVVEVLSDCNYKIISLYSKTNPVVTVVGNYLQGNLFDSNFIEELEKENFNVIVHCAALIPVQNTPKELEEIAKKNKIIDNNIIRLCKKQQIKLIFMSSTIVYGYNRDIPISEETNLIPEGSYGKAKRFSEEKILKELNKLGVIFRINSPYGPTIKKNTVLKIFIENALKNKDIKYFGSGNRKQDFIHVYDIAEAVKNVLLKNNVSGIFNIASGEQISMKKLAYLIISLIPNCKSKVIASGKKDLQENNKAIYDITKAERELNWKPKIKLEFGIISCINHLRDNN